MTKNHRRNYTNPIVRWLRERAHAYGIWMTLMTSFQSVWTVNDSLLWNHVTWVMECQILSSKINIIFSLKCAKGVKRSNCVVSHKRVEPKLFSDNKYRQNILGRLRDLDSFGPMFCLYQYNWRNSCGLIH